MTEIPRNKETAKDKEETAFHGSHFLKKISCTGWQHKNYISIFLLLSLLLLNYCFKSHTHTKQTVCFMAWIPTINTVLSSNMTDSSVSIIKPLIASFPLLYIIEMLQIYCSSVTEQKPLEWKRVVPPRFSFTTCLAPTGRKSPLISEKTVHVAQISSKLQCIFIICKMKTFIFCFLAVEP